MAVLTTLSGFVYLALEFIYATGSVVNLNKLKKSIPVVQMVISLALTIVALSLLVSKRRDSFDGNSFHVIFLKSFKNQTWLSSFS